MTIVSHETLSLKTNQRNGLGVDWTEAEIDILMRHDLKPKEMALHLPNRTRRAIYLKRHRLGVAAHYMRTWRRG
jgi:hypothetical protein